MDNYQFYNPFQNMFFHSNTCFLTGEDISTNPHYITFFPQWVLNRFSLNDKLFTMMNNVTSFKYSEMKLPCSSLVKDAYTTLDNEIKEAFNTGYFAVKNLKPEKLFIWSGLFVYCVLYHDLLIEKENKQKQNLEFKISKTLQDRFSLFHLMLQSLVAPIQFSTLKPWSITMVKLKYSKDIFNYRGDTVNLIFTLGVNGIGIIITLQDNEIVKQKENNLVSKLQNAVLHPIQFEELKARFIYHNYLLQYKPKYNITFNKSLLEINALPFKTENINTLFNTWNDKVFADVLTEYWKPWGLKKQEIYSFPNTPLSFLENENSYEFIEPDTIDLPH
jgi:hypothetical protein